MTPKGVWVLLPLRSGGILSAMSMLRFAVNERVRGTDCQRRSIERQIRRVQCAITAKRGVVHLRVTLHVFRQHPPNIHLRQELNHILLRLHDLFVSLDLVCQRFHVR